MKNLYVLLAGINDYQAPVSKLRGCLKDLDQIERIIGKYYAKNYHVHLRRLEDAAVTYHGIIDGFRTHLRQAGPDDVVWFHFSGHGSEEYTANAFWTLEPNGKDQTLVCFDSRAEGAEHLADKELAVLLHEVATTDTSGNPKGTPHIVVSLDCCHSGSGTRSAGEGETVIPRNTTSSGQKRQIATYLDGYYAAQGKQLQIPVARHVVLSACESVQFAGDLTSGGAFTTGLVDALERAGGNINYADLFLQTRSSVRKIRPEQTPQFETLENFNPYTRFIDGTPLGTPDSHEVVNENSTWYVKCGAIHGLPTNPASPIELDIYTPAPENALAGSAQILSVGAQRSVIDFSRNVGLKNLFGSLVTREAREYRAVIRHLPAPPGFVRLLGEEAATATLRRLWDASKNVRIAGADDTSSLLVNATGGRYLLRDLDRNLQAFETKGISDQDANAVIESLGKIVKWRRFITLENMDPQSRMQDIIDFEVQVLDTLGGRTPYNAREIKLYARPDNSDGWKFGFFPVVRLRNVQQQLFFYLFYLNANYAIECTDGEIVYRPEEHRDISNIELPLWKAIRGFGPEGGAGETTSYFKVLITTEKLDHQQFQQSGLGEFRSALSSWNPGKISDDWGQFTMRVTIAKLQGSTGPVSDLALAHDMIRIHTHPSFRAGVTIAGIEEGTTSRDPLHQFLMLRRNGLRPLRFSDSVDVIELHDFDSAALVEDPLEITLHGVTGGETIVPIAFDGEHFRIVGDAELADENTVVHIRSLPASRGASEEMIGLPFCNTSVHASLVQAVKVAFLEVSAEHLATLRKRSCVCCPE